ncbi:hypothetical protein MMC13_006177 [Lambiella insularis]|nr:hypothetical protein [Lambiella insularis]
MSHHYDKRHERPLMAQVMSFFTRTSPGDVLPAEEGEPVSDVDEPPDHHISKKPPPTESYFKLPALPASHPESLLTQALLTSPDLDSSSAIIGPRQSSRAFSLASTRSNASIASTAELTSDGGLTSPARTNTPSPPLPASRHTGLTIMTPKGLESNHNMSAELNTTHASAANASTRALEQIDPEQQLGRRRCITFACGGSGGKQPEKNESRPQPKSAELAVAPKRPCMLRFACPSRPSKEESGKLERSGKSQLTSPPISRPNPAPNYISVTREPSTAEMKTIGDICGITDASSHSAVVLQASEQRPRSAIKEAKFRNSGVEDDAWIHETPRQRHKITVSDTLRKENAIRKLGEEAEEEAREEEEAEEEAELDEDDEDASDGGNETDDEEGFADSDDENEVDPEYQFWTLGTSTAATSSEQLEYIRTRPRRTASQSSIESGTFQAHAANLHNLDNSVQRRKVPRRKTNPKMRPGTPELPDSTDFVCGTLDEDRPLEAAYMSCMEQRKLAKHFPTPQDLDPSFPTSDPEDDDEDEDRGASASDGNTWVTGRPDDSDGSKRRGRMENRVIKATRSPIPSPRRLRSPPPLKRCGAHRSPPPIKRSNTIRSLPPGTLFSHSPQRMLTPAPGSRIPISPSSSRRPSLTSSSQRDVRGIDMPRLAQRPNLTHTKSLPRTPNPFWSEHRRSPPEGLEKMDIGRFEPNGDDVRNDLHNRGPIDIVQGLENKRQRRKEKFWRQHCRQAGKERERRCQPGKGAQRMRELGLEVADRNRAYGQRAQLVLSV